MRVDEFAYDLPPELIAQEPAKERDQARLLLVDDVDNQLRHSVVANLAVEIADGSLIVVNDTKVIRARILGAKESGGKAEVFLIKREVGAEDDDDDDDDDPTEQRWRAMAKASKPMKPGAIVRAGPLTVEIEGKAPDDRGLFLVKLRAANVNEALKVAAHVPLPPYIKRPDRPEDEERYQTIFARAEGAVAAPTAGLHLTKELLQRLEAKGCEIASCTLHVGLGTFEPVKTDDLDDHPMHTEYFEVSPALASSIARARERHAPVVAIGTTVVRALESAAQQDGTVRASAEETRILIQPGYQFRVVDRLLTNFHLPKSTLLALVCAFAGFDRVMNAYRVAVDERYRFFSYGDAMLLTRKT